MGLFDWLFRRTTRRTLVFGEGANMIGGDHKDTYIRADQPLRSFGDTPIVYNSNIIPAYALFRFSLSGHIPTNAVIVSSVLTLTKERAPGVAAAIIQSVHKLLPPWGLTPTDEGTTQSPPIDDCTVYSRRYFISLISWTAPGNYSAVDRQAAENTFAMDNADAIGTVYTVSIPRMTQEWVKSDSDNHGFVIESNYNGWQSFHAQEAVVVGNRPYLTVTFTVPPARVVQSKISIHSGISMR